MDKIVAVWMLCVVGMFFGACTNEDSDSDGTAPEAIAGKTFSGVTPCAGCEGILYELSLDNEQQFKATSIYLGESNRPFKESGSYSIQDDTLLVLKGGEESRSFVIEDSTLVMLDNNRERVTGPLANYYILDRKEATADETGQRWADLRDQGVDFRASGNEPFWDVQIDFDEQIRFKMLEGDSIRTPVPEMEQDTSSKARLLQAETESGALTVALYPTGCMDNMSGEVFTHGVVVEYGDETYRGCGNYINDRYKLHDFWTVHSLNGTEVNPEDTLQKEPALQFDLAASKVYGNTGCNQLNGGKLTVQEDSLSFGPMVTTKMACPGTMELEKEFLDALNNVNGYDFDNEDLLLLQDDDTLIVLHRAGL